MKLLLLLPNVILIIISGYNLWNEFTTETPDYLAYKVLHATVFLICVAFTAIIIKSLLKSFTVNSASDTQVLEYM